MDDYTVYTWDAVTGAVTSESVAPERALHDIGWQVTMGLTVTRRRLVAPDGSRGFLLITVVSVVKGAVIEWYVRQ